jgi:hypothetical protein
MIGQFQPEIGRRLSGHPINDKLVMAVHFASTDPIVTLAGIPKIPEDTGIAGPGSYTSGNVTYTQGRNRYGRWAGFGGAALNSKFDWARSDFVPASGGCTILLLYEKGDGSNRNAVAFGLNNNNVAAEQCTATLPFGDGVIYFDYGGSGEGTNRLSVGGLTFGADRMVFSTGPRGMEIWQNGLKRASNGANPTRTAAPTVPFVLGARSAQALFSDVAHYNLFCMWARQLTSDEILMVSGDPYMLWLRP